LNTRYFPTSSNAWDSLAEAYLNVGDTVQAGQSYRRALALQTDNLDARRMLAKITHPVGGR
jgi:cytochrome c-type biogenesis protein CcmH/NrfG